MPPTHERMFKLRHYECDPFGHVNSANYLRLMQEAAFDASAAAGYDFQSYVRSGRQWLARDSAVEILDPLRYGDSVRVKTWVEDFRRVRSRRAYEFRRAGRDPEAGEVVARAHTDWVYVESATGRPAAIPPELVAAFLPEGPSAEAGARETFPAPPPPSVAAFRVWRRVGWQDIDSAWHVNNAAYLAYAGDAGMQASAAGGWPVSRMMGDGFFIRVRAFRIEYRQQAVLDDELEIATWVSVLDRFTAACHYAITRAGDGAHLARARTVWGCGEAGTGRLLPIPPALLADMAPNTAS